MNGASPATENTHGLRSSLIVEIDDARVFANVNTPADYEAVRGVFS